MTTKRTIAPSWPLALMSGIALGMLASQLALKAEAASPPAAEIVTSQSGARISILVSGREIARFDKGGLHVDGDIRYSGMQADTGKTDALWSNPE